MSHGKLKQENRIYPGSWANVCDLSVTEFQDTSTKALTWKMLLLYYEIKQFLIGCPRSDRGVKI